MYRKHGSADRGIDRLVFRVSVEKLGSSTAGWCWAGCAIKLYGYRHRIADAYSLASYRPSTYFDMNSAFDNDVFDGSGYTYYNSEIGVYWASGDGQTVYDFFGYTHGQTIELYSEFYPPGHVYGEDEVDWLFVTGSTNSSKPNPLTIFAENNIGINTIVKSIYCPQKSFYVEVKTRSGTNGLSKAYYSVYFGAPLNIAYLTGKLGYVRLITSAVSESSMSILVTRDGSDELTATVYEGEYLTVYPTRANDIISRDADLKSFSLELATNAGYVDTTKCVKYDSNIHDTANGGTNKLMHLHDFLSFTGTPAYFKDDTDEDLPDPQPTTGYTVTSQTLSVTYTADGNGVFEISSMILESRGQSTATINAYYQGKTINGGSNGSFNMSLQPGNPFSNVTSLIIRIVSDSGGSVNATLNTSQGGYFVSLVKAAGEYTGTINLTSNLSVTSITLVIQTT